MKCYNCKASIPDGSYLCPHCGQPQTLSRQLIDAAAGGDQSALSEVYNRTYNAVYNTVRFMVKDDDTALDILQDSYIRAFANLGQLQDAGRFVPWIKRIARNRAIDYLRRTKPIPFSSMVSDDSDEPVEFEDDRPENLPEAVVDRRETARLIGDILDALPDEQRACISLFYYDQLSVKEIAAELGIPEATVKSRLQYGRRKIEAQVRALEKKGTKLYGIAPIPFLMLLFRLRAQAAEIPSSAVLHGILSGTVGASAASGVSAANVAGAAVGQAVVKTAGASVLTKVVAAVVAVAVVGGGAAAVSHAQRVRQSRQEPIAAVETVIPMPEPTPVPEVRETAGPEPRETALPAGTEEPDLAPEHVYDAVLDRYADLLAMDAQTYLEQYDGRQDDGVNYDMVAEYFRNGGNAYWGRYDYNGDGIDELVIALGDGTYRKAWAVYTSDGQEAHELYVTEPLNYRVEMYVLPDSSLMIHSSGGYASGDDTICVIAADGKGLVVTARYVYDEETYGSMDHVGDGETLTDAEFNARYWDQAVEASGYGDIDFHLLSERAVPDQTDGTPEATAAPGNTEDPSSGEKGSVQDPVTVPASEALARLTSDTIVCCEGRLLVRIPESWNGKFMAEDRGGSVSFYDAYDRDRENGGFLFSLILSDYTSEDQIPLPSYEVIGKWSGDRLLIARFPTDVQYDHTDGYAASVYQEMYGQYDQVKKGLVLPESPLDTLLFCEGRAGMQYPDAWKGRVVLRYRTDSFGVYSLRNQAQGFGGHVFTLYLKDGNEDHTMYPRYDLLWTADGKKAIVLYPTDVQYDHTDADCAEEYDALRAGAADAARTIVSRERTE